MSEHDHALPIGSDSNDGVIRFEVIDHTAAAERPGRILVIRGDMAVTLSWQDDGRTLKVFLTERPHANPPTPETTIGT
jgi:hypothetical protein